MGFRLTMIHFHQRVFIVLLIVAMFASRSEECNALHYTELTSKPLIQVHLFVHLVCWQFYWELLSPYLEWSVFISYSLNIGKIVKCCVMLYEFKFDPWHDCWNIVITLTYVSPFSALYVWAGATFNHFIKSTGVYSGSLL